MTEQTAKYIIIGAGLSGLTSAYQLNKRGETDLIILESRDRIGGRILTQDGIDFGATWFQNHHKHVIDLLDDLGIPKFQQYDKGKSVLVYNTMAPAHYFQNDPNAPSAYRIAGGSQAIIDALVSKNKDRVRLSNVVTEINLKGEHLEVVTDKATYKAEKVIVTIPPRIVPRISFSPSLPEKLIDVMQNTHTWMSNAMKVGLTYQTPFWRNKDLSGMLIGQVGAVTELYDHSCKDEHTFALMGFINEGLREVSEEERKARILEHLQKYLGAEALEYLSYEEKDWSKDKNTSCDSIKSIYMSPRYGNSEFSKVYFNNKLVFSGAETSSVYGGYMDGAIYSGIKAADRVFN